MNHYQVLGVEPTATIEEIKQKYRKLASIHHPDKPGGDTEKFQQIQAAYATVGDESNRARYDSELAGRGKFTSHQFSAGMDQFDEIIKNFGFSFGHDSTQWQPRKNRDIRVNIAIELADTLAAQSKTVSIQTTNGFKQTVAIDIPAGIQTGSSIRYPGLGDNFLANLPRGDLYIHFTIAPNQKFQVVGTDLLTNIDIDCLRAIIGCEKEIVGLDGAHLMLTVPPGTQPGTKFRIQGHGLYEINRNSRGNLYMVVNITVPSGLSLEQLTMIENVVNKTK